MLADRVAASGARSPCVSTGPSHDLLMNPRPADSAAPSPPDAPAPADWPAFSLARARHGAPRVPFVLAAERREGTGSGPASASAREILGSVAVHDLEALLD